jgi:hypothetical protein
MHRLSKKWDYLLTVSSTNNSLSASILSKFFPFESNTALYVSTKLTLNVKGNWFFSNATVSKKYAVREVKSGKCQKFFELT